MNLWAQGGRGGRAFLSSLRPSCGLGPSFYLLVLTPAVWGGSSCFLCGLGDNELVCLLRKSLSHLQTEPSLVCPEACRTQAVAADGKTKAGDRPRSPSARDGGALLSGAEPPMPHPGRLDVGVEHVSDCERLAKQCQLWDLLSDLEAKCEKVSEFGASRFRVQGVGWELPGPTWLPEAVLSPPQWHPSQARV